VPASARGAIAVACLIAFVLRVIRLDEPVLRWDEGWSIAHATLPWDELLRIAGEDWHPPLYTLLLKAWLWLGKSVYQVRYLSVLLGVLGVPLAGLVAWRWSGRAAVAVLSALFAAAWPLLVYYGQVTRMYPLVVVAVLLAAYGLLRLLAHDRWSDRGLLALGTGAAMYSLYYAVWPLLGLYAWGVLARPRRWRGLLLAGLAALLLYGPWLPAAASTILFRTTDQGPGPGPLDYLLPTLDGLAFTFGTSRLAALWLALVLLVGLVAFRPTLAELARLALPAVVILLGVAGMLLGAARSNWFAIRHLAPVAPFLGLALAWAIDRAARRRVVLAGALAAALAASYWPTASGFVYAKTLEVVDPFDPAADHRYIAEHGRPDDLVFFNVLSTAGWYEQLRRGADPAWSHTLRWDPIVEPLELVVARQLEPAIAARERIWFVLYKGDVGPNGPLVDWLEADRRLFPAGGAWREDTWYRLFVVPAAEPSSRRLEASGAGFAEFGPVRLVSARVTDRARPGGVVAVELVWSSAEPSGDAKVFVHLVDERGRLVAQHDGYAASDRRPPSTWRPGELVHDRHGVTLPQPGGGRAAEPLEVRIGLYSASTGQRLRLPNGADYLSLGLVRPG
jgi:hypothetical protein